MVCLYIQKQTEDSNLNYRYTGAFFDNSTPSETGTFRLSMETSWQQSEYQF